MHIKVPLLKPAPTHCSPLSDHLRLLPLAFPLKGTWSLSRCELRSNATLTLTSRQSHQVRLMGSLYSYFKYSVLLISQGWGITGKSEVASTSNK